MKTNGALSRVGRKIASGAISEALSRAGASIDLYQTLNGVVGRAMRRAMYEAVAVAVLDDPPHPAFADFLSAARKAT